MSEKFDPSNWITTTQAAELTGYTPGYFRKAIKRGRLQGQKLGRDWILLKKEVEAYAEKMRRLGPQKHDPWREGAREKKDGGT
jgi:excisionase family DNA binding protein